MSNVCPICSSGLNSPVQISGHSYYVDCPRCGRFIISDTACIGLQYKPLNGLQTANASVWIRENQGITILSNDIETLENLKTPTVAEKANKLLMYLSKVFPTPGQVLNFDWKELSLLSITWSQNFEEFSYLFRDYLHTEKGFLIYQPKEFRISPEGWAYIDSLNQINPESQIVFVAMWFDDGVKPLWKEAIKLGIEAAGYKPLRIDMHQHNNRIDDEIITMIRRSKFLVADFTGQRGGVYFEAGFALGMGLPVIWVCHKGELKEVHFDTRQYNFITWEDEKLDDLKQALQYRIEATVLRLP